MFSSWNLPTIWSPSYYLIPVKASRMHPRRGRAKLPTISLCLEQQLQRRRDDDVIFTFAWAWKWRNCVLVLSGCFCRGGFFFDETTRSSEFSCSSMMVALVMLAALAGMAGEWETRCSRVTTSTSGSATSGCCDEDDAATTDEYWKKHPKVVAQPTTECQHNDDEITIKQQPAAAAAPRVNGVNFVVYSVL